MSRSSLARAAAVAAPPLLALAILLAPPARLGALVASDDPWIVYDEFVIPEAAVAHVLGRDPATILGTPAGPNLLLASALVPLVAPRSFERPQADRLTAAGARLDEACRELLLDPRPLVIPLRVFSVACALLAAVTLGATAASLSGRISPWLAGAIGGVLLLQPVVAWLMPTSLVEMTALAFESLFLAVALRSAPRLASATTGSAFAAWLLPGALAGAAGATKANYGVAACLGAGAFVVLSAITARRHAPLAALAAIAVGSLCSFLVLTPHVLARPFAFLKAQAFTIGLYGGRARADADVLGLLVAGLGLLLLAAIPCVAFGLRSRAPAVRFLTACVLAYAAVLATARVGKLPWLLPMLPPLLLLLFAALCAWRERSPRTGRAGATAAILLLAATGAFFAARGLRAAASPRSSGRALRAWARTELSRGGTTLVVGRHLELPVSAEAAAAQLTDVKAVLHRRERELPISLSAPLLVEERFDELKATLLAREEPDDPQRFDVRHDTWFALDELPSVLASGRFERLVIPASLLAESGAAEAGYRVVREFLREPHAPPATSFDLVVLSRAP